MEELQRELEEAKLEIARHHKHFKEVSEICDKYLTAYKQGGFILLDGVTALRMIRNIVG
jgi:hypothetical protein